MSDRVSESGFPQPLDGMSEAEFRDFIWRITCHCVDPAAFTLEELYSMVNVVPWSVERSVHP